MKFLHTSDIRYGATPDADKPWGKECAAAIKETFDRTIRVCYREKIDLLLIAGGLFDSLPTEQQITEVNDAFGKISETKIVIAPGKNDKLFASSPALTFPWNNNVTYLAGTACAPAFYDSDSGICMHPGSRDDIANPSQYSYLALGGTSGCYMGEIDEQKHLVSLKSITFPTIKNISLSVSITPASSNADVLKGLRREIERRGNKNIYKIRLKGFSDPSVMLDLSTLVNTYRISEVIDCTEPKYDFTQLFKDHSSDMIGFFVKEMNRDDIGDLDKKAMYYGINALLKTADERS